MKLEYNGNIQDLIDTIKHIMIDKKIKQNDIAEKMGISKQTVSNIFNGRQPNITLDTLVKLCNAIDCKLYIDIE